jgi:organic hydroperoxide reductase OsmC/OhrA
MTLGSGDLHSSPLLESAGNATAAAQPRTKAQLQQYAEESKSGCPVSRALGAIEIGLEARLT